MAVVDTPALEIFTFACVASSSTLKWLDHPDLNPQAKNLLSMSDNLSLC